MHTERVFADVFVRFGEVARAAAERAADIRDAEERARCLTSVIKAMARTPTEARRLIERLEPVYTPKHGSWLDIAEIELNVLARQCLDRRIPDKPTLVREVGAWERERNATRKPVDWRFTTDDARIKLKRLYPQIQG